jgi:hypothetical protein
LKELGHQTIQAHRSAQHQLILTSQLPQNKKRTPRNNPSRLSDFFASSDSPSTAPPTVRLQSTALGAIRRVDTHFIDSLANTVVLDP